MADEKDQSDRNDEQKPGSLASQATIVGTTALAAAIAIPGPAGAAIGAAATIYTLAGLDKLTSVWRERSRNNAEYVLDTAAHAIGGMTAVELVEHIKGDPERERLLAIAAIAGGETVLTEKIKALGKALADGILAKDDAKVNEQAMILAAMRDIEAPHVKVISMMFNNREPGPPDGWFRKFVYRPWTREHFQRDSSFGITLRSILATLERHAIIVPMAPDYVTRLNMLRRYPTAPFPPDPIKKWIEEASRMSESWILSDMGVCLHEYLLESATEPPAS